MNKLVIVIESIHTDSIHFKHTDQKFKKITQSRNKHIDRLEDINVQKQQ